MKLRTLWNKTLRWPGHFAEWKAYMDAGLLETDPIDAGAPLLERIAEAAGWTIGAALYGMGETVQEELERFIFVHHRRAVAQSRRRRAPPEQC